MSNDVSKLNINNFTYNIKDSTAREKFANYLPLSGGTMTGDLKVNNLTCDDFVFNTMSADSIEVDNINVNEMSAESIEVDDIDIVSLAVDHLSSISISDDTLEQILSRKSDDSHTHEYLPLSGGKMTGDLSVDHLSSIVVDNQSLSTILDNLSAALKTYTDDQISGIMTTIFSYSTDELNT